MMDKRQLRKHPGVLAIYKRTEVRVRGDGVNFWIKGTGTELNLTRGEARKLRDWLNHALEFVAQEG